MQVLGAHGTAAPTYPSPTELQVAIAFSMQLVWPGVHTPAWQAFAWQYWPVGQSAERMHRTQDPDDRSQSRPRGVHVRSESHLVRQALATHVWVASAQSASVRQATQRPLVALHTSIGGHSREFLHGTNETHLRAVQSLFAGQSAGVTHSTHAAIDESQTIPAVQSRLFRQPGGVPASDRVVSGLTPPHAPAAAPITAITRERNR
jgi:hypothetical protein